MPVALIALTFRVPVADWNDVPTGSMKPTIPEGDRIHVNKLAYGLRVPLTNTWIAHWGQPERGEIIGGSQREHNLDVLLERMKEEGRDTEPYEWYLDLRRHGTVPPGGFGLAVERTLARLRGLKHIRETIPYARMMGRIYP